MIKITGLDKLSRDIDDAKRVLEHLNGELGSVSFDPDDPSSIDTAIRTIESVVDGRLGRYATNPIIAPLAKGMKDAYCNAILEKAATIRLQGR